MFWLGWLASKLLGSPVFVHPMLGLQTHATLLWQSGCWGSKLRSNTLYSETQPHLLCAFFCFVLFLNIILSNPGRSQASCVSEIGLQLRILHLLSALPYLVAIYEREKLGLGRVNCCLCPLATHTTVISKEGPSARMSGREEAEAGTAGVRVTSHLEESGEGWMLGRGSLTSGQAEKWTALRGVSALTAPLLP